MAILKLEGPHLTPAEVTDGGGVILDKYKWNRPIFHSMNTAQDQSIYPRNLTYRHHNF